MQSHHELTSLVEWMRANGVQKLKTLDVEIELGSRPVTPLPMTEEERKELEGRRKEAEDEILFWSADG